MKPEWLLTVIERKEDLQIIQLTDRFIKWSYGLDISIDSWKWLKKAETIEVRGEGKLEKCPLCEGVKNGTHPTRKTKQQKHLESSRKKYTEEKKKTAA